MMSCLSAKVVTYNRFKSTDTVIASSGYRDLQMGNLMFVERIEEGSGKRCVAFRTDSVGLVGSISLSGVE